MSDDTEYTYEPVQRPLLPPDYYEGLCRKLEARIAELEGELARTWQPVPDGTYDHIGVQRNGEVICVGEYAELGQRYWSGRFLPANIRLCRATEEK